MSQPDVFRIIALRAGLGLLAKGIKPNSAWTLSATLRAASRFTGRGYKVTRKACELARADLAALLPSEPQ